MKFYDRKFDGKKSESEQEEFGGSDSHFKKRKKERREKYKPKNQKFHQLGYEEEDDMELL